MIHDFRGYEKAPDFKDGDDDEEDILELWVFIRVCENSFEDSWQQDHYSIVDETY